MMVKSTEAAAVSQERLQPLPFSYLPGTDSPCAIARVVVKSTLMGRICSAAGYCPD